MGQSIRVGDECEALTSSNKIVYFDTRDVALMAQYGEHEDSGDDGGQEIQGGDDGSCDVDLVLKLVVAPEHEEAAPGDGEREKHLLSCFPPNLKKKKSDRNYLNEKKTWISAIDFSPDHFLGIKRRLTPSKAPSRLSP